MTLVKIKDKEFYLDELLRQRLDNIKEIVNKKNFDCVFLIDGLERVGKSTLGITCAYYLSEGNFDINNIATDSVDAVNKIESLPDKSVLLIDEGSMVFNSKDGMKQEQKQLMKIINVVGQKNLIFIIVLPCFFDLNKQIAVRRSKFLLHCYADNELNRGRFAYFGEDDKKRLYTYGKRNYDSYSFPKRTTAQLGRYTDFNPLGQEYIEAKKKSLYSALHEDERNKQDRLEERQVQIISNVEKYNWPDNITQVMKAGALGISHVTYIKYVKLAREKGLLA